MDLCRKKGSMYDGGRRKARRDRYSRRAVEPPQSDPLRTRKEVIHRVKRNSCPEGDRAYRFLSLIWRLLHEINRLFDRLL